MIINNINVNKVHWTRYIWNSKTNYMKRIIQTTASFFLVLVLFACGGGKTSNITLETTVSAEGPFFQGGNSLVADIPLNIKELVGDESLQEVTSVKVTKAVMQMEEGALASFNNATLQFVSDANPMTTVAIINPISGEGESVNFTTSDEAEIESFFNEESFTVLLDLDFKEDQYLETVEAKVNMNLTIEYK